VKKIARECLLGGSVPGSVAADIGLTVPRIAAGLMLAIGHGWGKMPPSEGFIAGVEDLGFPLPILFAWLAGISEFFGGVLLALGLFTRPAAMMIAGTMFVAAFIRHWDDAFFLGGGGASKEPAILYLIIALAFVLAGSRRFSIDRQLR